MPRRKETTAPRRPGGRLPNVVLAIGCLAMAWLGAVVARPYLLALRLRADNRELGRQIGELQIANQRLRKQISALDTPAGQEREARKLGYVRPGEVPILMK